MNFSLAPQYPGDSQETLAATDSAVKRSLQSKSKGRTDKEKKAKKEKKSKDKKKDKKGKGKVKQVPKVKSSQPSAKDSQRESKAAKDTFVRDLEREVERNLEPELAAAATPQGTQIDSQERGDEHLVGVVPYLKGNWQSEIRKLMINEDYRRCYIDSHGWHLEFTNENCVLNHVPARAQFPLIIYRCPGPAVVFSEKQEDDEELKRLQENNQKEVEEQKRLQAIKEKEAEKAKAAEEEKRLQEIKQKEVEQKKLQVIKENEAKEKEAEEKKRLQEIKQKEVEEQKKLQATKEKEAKEKESEEKKRLQEIKQKEVEEQKKLQEIKEKEAKEKAEELKNQKEAEAVAANLLRPGTQDLDPAPPTPMPPSPVASEMPAPSEVPEGLEAAAQEAQKKLELKNKRHAQWARFIRSLEGRDGFEIHSNALQIQKHYGHRNTA